MIWPYDVDLWPFDLDACQLHSPKHLMTSDLWPRRLSVTQSQAPHDLWPFDLDACQLHSPKQHMTSDLLTSTLFDLDTCQLHSPKHLMTSDLLTSTLVSYTVPSSSWPLTFWPRRLSVTQSQASHDFWPFDLDACQLHSLMTSDLLTLTLVSYTVPSSTWPLTFWPWHLSVTQSHDLWPWRLSVTQSQASHDYPFLRCDDQQSQVAVNAAVVPRDRLAVSLEQIHNQVQLVSVLHQTTTTFNGSLHVQQASELNVFNVQYCGKHRWFFRSWSHILTHCSNPKMQWLASLG